MELLPRIYRCSSPCKSESRALQGSNVCRFWEKVIFDTTPDAWSLCGIILILGSTVFVAINPSSTPSDRAHHAGEIIQNEQAESLLPLTVTDSRK